MSRPVIVFATRNAGKLREVSAALGEAAQLRSLSDYPPVPEPKEDGENFAEIALAKALAYAGLLALHLEEGALVLAERDHPGRPSAFFGDTIDTPCRRRRNSND